MILLWVHRMIVLGCIDDRVRVQWVVGFDYMRFGLIRFILIWFGSIQIVSVRLGSNMIRFDSIPFGCIYLIWPGSVGFGCVVWF